MIFELAGVATLVTEYGSGHVHLTGRSCEADLVLRESDGIEFETLTSM